jgi:hypothetical protein
MARVTTAEMKAIEYLDSYARQRKDRPFRLSPSDVSAPTGSTPQLIGMAQEGIIAELRLRNHIVFYEKVNNKRHFVFR